MDKLDIKKLSTITIWVVLMEVLITSIFASLTMYNNNLHFNDAHEFERLKQWGLITMESGYIVELISIISLIFISLIFLAVFLGGYSKIISKMIIAYFVILLLNPIISGILYFYMNFITERVYIDNMNGLAFYYIIGLALFVLKTILIIVALIKLRKEILKKEKVLQ